MKILNKEVLPIAKICIVVNNIESRDMSKYSNPLIKAGVKLTEILFVGLFDSPMKSISVGELRKGVSELEELLKCTGVNVVVDASYLKDSKGEITRFAIFKKVLDLDASKWSKLGVCKKSLLSDDYKVKLVCGIRAESIAREKNSSEILDNEFKIKDFSELNLVDIRDEKGLERVANFLKGASEISIDIETNMVDFAHKDFKILCIQYGRTDKPLESYVCWYEKNGVSVTEKYKDMWIKLLKWTFNGKKDVVAHNGCQFDFCAICLRFNIDPQQCKFYDTLITHYVALNSTVRPSLDLKTLAFPILGEYESELDKFKNWYCKEHNIAKKDFSYDLIPEHILFEYSALDIVALNFVRFNGEELCRNHLAGDIYEKAFLNYYKPLSNVIVDMVVEGIPFDYNGASVEMESLQNQLDSLNNKIREDEAVDMAERRLAQINFEKAMEKYKEKVAKAEAQGKTFKGLEPDKNKEKYDSIELHPTFNFDSKNHMAVLLFDVLKCKSLKETKSGNASTDSDTTEKLADLYPNISFLRYFKEIAKLSKQIDSFYKPYIEKARDSIDGKIRGIIQANGTQSGRFSMRDVNLMQLPKKSELKKFMTLPPEGDYVYIYADYASLETYIAGLESNSNEILGMLEIAPEDSHSYLLLGMYGHEFPNLDRNKAEDRRFIKDNYSERRDAQKTKVFQLIYGASEYGIANGFNISVEEAKEFYDAYWETNYELKNYFDNVEDFAKKNGYVTLSEGQPLLTPDANHSDKGIRQASKRSYGNSKLQCYASKTNIGMMNTMKWCLENKLYYRNVLQTHDSGIIKVKKENALIIAKKFKEELERDFLPNQRISLVADPELTYNVKGGYVLEGNNWEDLVDKFFEGKIQQKLI